MNALREVLQPVGLFWLGLIAAAILAYRKKAKGSATTSAVIAVLLYFGGASPLPAYLLGRLERPYDRPISPAIPAADAVVMLGGSHAFSHRELLHFIVGPTSNRLLTAFELIRLGKAPNLVLGGSKYKYKGAERPDSELILTWVRAWKIPSGNVYTLGICRDTRDEAFRVSELAAEHKWKRVLLVTSAGHMRRAEATFRKVGVEVIPAACDYAGLAWLDSESTWRLVPTVEGLSILQRWMHEQIGWWVYWWKGWL